MKFSIIDFYDFLFEVMCLDYKKDSLKFIGIV